MVTYYNPSQSSEVSFSVAEADLYLPTRVTATLSNPVVTPGTSDDTQVISGILEYQENGTWYGMGMVAVKIEVKKPGSSTFVQIGTALIPGFGVWMYTYAWKPTEVGTHVVRVSYAGTAPTGGLYGAYPSSTEIFAMVY